MRSLELAVLAGTLIVIATVIGAWPFSMFTAEVKTATVVYPIAAYVDKTGTS
jgi:hypothetical protein